MLLKQVPSASEHSFQHYRHKRPGRTIWITLYYTVTFLTELHILKDLLVKQYLRSVQHVTILHTPNMFRKVANVDNVLKNTEIGWFLAA